MTAVACTCSVLNAMLVLPAPRMSVRHLSHHGCSLILDSSQDKICSIPDLHNILWSSILKLPQNLKSTFMSKYHGVTIANSTTCIF